MFQWLFCGMLVPFILSFILTLQSLIGFIGNTHATRFLLVDLFIGSDFQTKKILIFVLKGSMVKNTMFTFFPLKCFYGSTLVLHCRAWSFFILEKTFLNHNFQSKHLPIYFNIINLTTLLSFDSRVVRFIMWKFV